MTTITDALIVQIARRIRQLQDYRPGGGSDLEPVDAGSLLDARDAIAAHIALSEIMPPDRATLLAAADAAGEVSLTQGNLGKMHDLHFDRARARMHFAAMDAWLKFANALRAKAGEAGE